MVFSLTEIRLFVENIVVAKCKTELDTEFPPQGSSSTFEFATKTPKSEPACFIVRGSERKVASSCFS